MDHKLLEDFKVFLVRYRAAWNGLDAKKLSMFFSKVLQVRWAAPHAGVHDWGFENAVKGWEQAYKGYEGKSPKWYFEDILVKINQQQEGVAIFWTTFECEGSLTNNQLLFVETFRKENNQWKKLREYVENGFEREGGL